MAVGVVGTRKWSDYQNIHSEYTVVTKNTHTDRNNTREIGVLKRTSDKGNIKQAINFIYLP